MFIVAIYFTTNETEGDLRLGNKIDNLFVSNIYIHLFFYFVS